MNNPNTDSPASAERTIEAIPTTWQGTCYRSRLEARWGIFFYHLGVHALYEYKGFNLPSGDYLPDFWLPEVKMFAEVKPKPFTEQEYLRAKELALATSCSVLMLVEKPDFRPYTAIEPLDPWKEREYLLDIEYLPENRFYSQPEANTYPYSTEECRHATNQARSFRFKKLPKDPA